MPDETDIQRPYLLFLGDAHDDLAAKTAHGIADWRREHCVGQYRLPGCRATLDLPELGPGAAVAAGARTMVIGAVNPGGQIPDSWIYALTEALDNGLDLASGMHARLEEIPQIAAAAARNGRRLHNVRHPARSFSTGSGLPRTGKRLLTMGTDCSVGKKYTALALERDMRGRGIDADFRATGQTGILIAGAGVAIDAVIADFISGAAEWLSPPAPDDHWDIIEGQGSLFHPSFAGVTLGLLHGAQPDAFVLCHEPTRKTLRNVAAPIPDIADCIDLILRLGQMTNPAIRCVGIAVNTVALPDDAAHSLLREMENAYQLPCIDPVRDGTGPIIDRLLHEA